MESESAAGQLIVEQEAKLEGRQISMVLAYGKGKEITRFNLWQQKIKLRPDGQKTLQNDWHR